ncbi:MULTISPECIES: response regulator [unclassified Paenibacillus]|uniref:response regulator transcription factor n=1 Tax=unclassified Paenibacillus TaxID=185978 RepID=UPI000956300C|nr:MULTISPECIES: response regulator [unclassified Paenibacillus]ASS68577.1 response regulator [Paenibacillus sp. RUD330]SIR63857.1 Helix-turn-helix domain-containing protein [Paenibacillus sp. RU4X]SIR72047.1 Helix-turn-helix domain-containing protein [Paenibacillus sp. RU4T]
MKTLLIVDDEPRTRLGIQKTLTAWSAGRHRIETAASGVEALEWLKANTAHIIITDVRMPEVDGLQMLETLAGRGPLPVIIVVSGYAEFDYARKALQLGAFDYILKPLDKDILAETVQRAFALDDGRDRIDAMEKLVDAKLLEVGRGEARYGTPIKDAISFIDAHLEEPISMKQVAELTHLNASYFSVLFKEQTGVTFSDYLTRLRLQRAKELLVATRMPISEIAEKVGYGTAKYFIKVFKDNEGTSPRQYRSQVLDADSSIR